MTSEELLDRATEFDAGNPVHLNGVIYDDNDVIEPHHHYYIKIRVSRGDNAFRNRWWAICQGSMTLSCYGEWEFEPRSSNRVQAYLDAHRYPSVQAAFDHLDAWKAEERKRALAKGFKTRHEHLVDLDKTNRKKHFFDFWNKHFSK